MHQQRLELSGLESLSNEELELRLIQCRHLINYSLSAKRGKPILDDLYRNRRAIQTEMAFRFGAKESDLKNHNLKEKP